jgi:hypothetical protein
MDAVCTSRTCGLRAGRASGGASYRSTNYGTAGCLEVPWFGGFEAVAFTASTAACTQLGTRTLLFRAVSSLL